MDVVVTGFSGFVGTRLREAFPEDWTIHAVVRDGSKVPDGTNAVVADFANSDWCDALPNRYDAVMHLAQSTAYREFPSGSRDVFRVNLDSTAQLLEHGRRAGAERFCLFSSGSVYEPYDRGLDESVCGEPTSLNGASKLAAEAYAGAYQSVFSLSILRVFFPYGPGQHGRLVPILKSKIERDEPIELAQGTGMHLAPVFVDDLALIGVDAISQGWRGRCNVAGPDSYSVYEIAETIAALLGRTACYVETTEAAVSLCPPLAKLHSRFSRERLTALEEGLRITLETSDGTVA